MQAPDEDTGPQVRGGPNRPELENAFWIGGWCGVGLVTGFSQHAEENLVCGGDL